MCEYCGCKGVPVITELMDEHADLVERGNRIRLALGSGDSATAFELVSELVGLLRHHVRREEAGVLRAMREDGEFADEVDGLEGEHRDLDLAIAALDPASVEFAHGVARLLDDLDQHIEREELGIFPVSVVTLGSAGWRVVEDAHSALPSFLGVLSAGRPG